MQHNFAFYILHKSKLRPQGKQDNVTIIQCLYISSPLCAFHQDQQCPIQTQDCQPPQGIAQWTFPNSSNQFILLG